MCVALAGDFSCFKRLDVEFELVLHRPIETADLMSNNRQGDTARASDVAQAAQSALRTADTPGPLDIGIRKDDDESLLPVGPNPSQCDPE